MKLNLDTLGVQVTFDTKMHSNKDRTIFYRELYGYKDIQKGKYTYVKPGVISNIKYLKPTRSAIILSLKDAKVLRAFLKKYPAVKFDEKLVVLNEREARELGLNHPKGWRRIYEELKGNENTVFSVDF